MRLLRSQKFSDQIAKPHELVVVGGLSKVSVYAKPGDGFPVAGHVRRGNDQYSRIAAPPAAPEVPENVIAILFRQVQVEKHQSGAGCVRIPVSGIEEPRCGIAVGNEVQVCVHVRARDGFPDEKHICFAVLDHEDLRRRSLPFMQEA